MLRVLHPSFPMTLGGVATLPIIHSCHIAQRKRNSRVPPNKECADRQQQQGRQDGGKFASRSYANVRCTENVKRIGLNQSSRL
ncbi:hypothetical protein CEXT_323731 [Caerostris extrusa]|uniref:Secreted protein n=1 Tax=Caerostris extrusa TaxID=172846 RepID=A0AAV4NDU8_CAEEX|nr:hypothetical protein CEXT_323731 [Caerostris extrusa]